MSLENYGNSGDVLDATANGLVPAPAASVWFPGTAGNELTSPGFTIPSTLGILPLPFTDGLLTITEADIAATTPAAASFPASTGQTVTVNRGSSGPVTVLAPQPVLVNPDEVGYITLVNQELGATEDGLLIFAGQKGNDTGSNSLRLIRISQDVNAFVIYPNANDASVAGRFRDTTPDLFDTGYTTVNANEFALVVYALRLDRSTDILTLSTYDASGLLDTQTVATSDDLATIENTLEGRALDRLPGTFSAATFRKGVGIAPSDTDLAIMADYLLTATA